MDERTNEPSERTKVDEHLVRSLHAEIAKCREKARETAYVLETRIRELTCLCKVASLLHEPVQPFDKVIDEILNTLVSGYQYPDIAMARASIAGKWFHTTRFAFTPWYQTAPLMTGEQFIGEISVFYLEERPGAYEGPFLAEERHLLDAVADLLSRLLQERRNIEAREASEAHYRSLFEQLVDAYTLLEAIPLPTGEPGDYRVLEANPVFARYAGLTREGIVGHTLRGLFPRIEPSWIETFNQVLLSGSAQRISQYSALFNRHLDATIYRPTSNRIAALFTDVTARKHSEEERDRASLELKETVSQLRRRTAQMSRAEQLARLGYWEANMLSGEVLWSEGMASLLGFPSQPQHRKIGELYRFVHADDVVAVQRAVAEATQNGIPYKCEFRAFDLSGNEHFVRIRGEIEFDARGRPIDNFGVAQDITEIKRAEAALRESETRYRDQKAELELIYSTAPIGLCVLDTHLRYVHVNERLAEFNGISAQAHLGKTVREVLPTMASRIEPLLRQVIETGKPVLDVESGSGTPGHERHWLSQYWPLKSSDGAVFGINVVMEEVSERLWLEETRRREQEFRTLAENSTDIVVRFDRNLRRAYANPAIETMLGQSVSEVIGKTNHELGIPPELSAFLDQHVERVFTTGLPLQMEVTLPTPNGERVLDSRLVPEHDSEGNIATVLAISRDITDRKRAEEELYRREQEFEALVERSPDVILRVDRSLRITYISPAIERLTGRPRHSFEGKTPKELDLPAHEQELRESALKRVFECGKEEMVEHENPTPTGTRYFQSRLVPEFDGDGNLQSVLVVDRDINDLKRAQFALEHLALHDPMTGIANRRYLQQFIDREWGREVRHRHSIAVIMADIDAFKAYNDLYGHQLGDECLRMVAETLRAHLRRPTDLLVRYGGEEFAAVLLETDGAAAGRLAAELREAVMSKRLPHAASPVASVVTVSFGVAAAPAHLTSFDDLLSAADDALYQAKQKGRNRVESAGATTGSA